jgi:F0F1-type ATP synthase membrane subunit b/b'
VSCSFRKPAKGIPPFFLWLSCLAAVATLGCAGHSSSSSYSYSYSSSSTRPGQVTPMDPQEIQARIMSFADSYVTAMADVYEKAHLSSKTLQGKITAQGSKLSAGIGAMGNAVNPNPVQGMMDMAIMVTLTREISEEPWSTQLFGPENASAITSRLKIQEVAIWELVGSYLSPEQIQQLHQLAEQWRQKNPEQRFVTATHLADLQLAQKSGKGGLDFDVSGLAGLSPFNSLDPAVQQVEQSRILAERGFFYGQHMPLLIAWQVDLLYSQILAEPQMKQLVEDTNQFADVGNRVSETVEKLRLQLPDQQAQLVEQVNQLVTHQRDAALQQATTQVSVILQQATTQVSALRDTTLNQVNASLVSQQDALIQHVQGLTDSAIDRLYWRVRSLIFIAAGSIIGAVLINRLIATRIFGTKVRS